MNLNNTEDCMIFVGWYLNKHHPAILDKFVQGDIDLMDIAKILSNDLKTKGMNFEVKRGTAHCEIVENLLKIVDFAP